MIFLKTWQNETEELIYYINELINFENVTSIIAVSDKKIAEKLGGRQVKIKFGSIE